MTNNLIIFIKNPVKGTVKTRLARDVGDELALKVYHDLLVRCKDVCLSVKAKRYLFYSNNIERDEWNDNRFNKHVQSQGDLGDRITTAFKYVQKENRKTIIIGSDCYDLNEQIITEAFDHLDNCELVIGPANDGGYYLIGTNHYYPDLFENISWSSEKVLQQTLDQAKKLNLTPYLLERLVDIDTVEDISLSSYSQIFKNYDRKNSRGS